MLKPEITCANGVRFEIGGNGLLKSICLPEDYGGRNLLAQQAELLVEDENGKTLRLMEATGNAIVRNYKNSDGSRTLVFNNLAFQGRGDIRLNFKYDFYQDGTFFIYAFLCGDSCNPRPLSRFEFKCKLAFQPEDKVRAAVFYRPVCADGTLIQTSAPDREVTVGQNCIFGSSIMPMDEFMVETDNGPVFYAELFVEGDGSLAGKSNGTASSLTWEGGNAVLSWNFQTSDNVPAGGVWQWRNTFGGVIAPAARKRHCPPFVMYHFFDNYLRYPTPEILDAIAEAGADVLILHENWRMDVQNGGIPFRYDELERVVKAAHEKNIRIALYMRGNELSAIEDGLDWFDGLLTPDYDGIYMDYGGPFHYIEAPTENYPRGRIDFRRHYQECLRRRRHVGRNGLVFSHTGPMFSALGLTGGTVDSYVSGEGEQGLLLRSRLDNIYYSMAPVCPGSLWSAAFPEYGSKAMVPFLAATGQFPHLPLGTQIKTSSLSHPPAPGIADASFIKIWRLWQLLRGKRDLEVRNDYNCVGIFPRQRNVSHYLMFTDELAVCIFANFSDAAVCVDMAIDWGRAGVKLAGRKQTLCQDFKATAFGGELRLGDSEVAALVIGEADFAQYMRPMPPLPRANEKHLAIVEEQRRAREPEPLPCNWKMRVAVPDLPLTYEMSMVVDLYDNRFVLGRRSEDGSFSRLGYIGRNGLQAEPTIKEDFVLNGQQSPWFELKPLLGEGIHRLAIQSLHRDDLHHTDIPFYSFLQVELESDDGRCKCIRFMNELEEDRSFVNFSVRL